MEEDLAARLLADSGVAAIVGVRVNWVERPQGESLPAIVLQIVSSGRDYVLDGPQSLREDRVQADCWGLTYAAAKSAARAVIAALEPPATHGSTKFNGAFVDAERDGREDIGTALVFRTSLDLMVWHRPA